MSAFGIRWSWGLVLIPTVVLAACQAPVPVSAEQAAVPALGAGGSAPSGDGGSAADSSLVGEDRGDVAQDLPEVEPSAGGPSAEGDAFSAVAHGIAGLGADRGFCGVSPDGSRRAMTVLWSGPVPEDVRRLAGESGLRVSFTSDSKYSRAELNAAVERLGGSDVLQRRGLAGMDPWEDCNGLTIRLTGDEAPSSAEVAQLEELAGVAELKFKLNAPTPTGY